MFSGGIKKRRSGVFIVNFEHISHLILVFLLLTLNMQLPAGYETFCLLFYIAFDYDNKFLVYLGIHKRYSHIFQSESTLCSCLNVKEFLARNRRDI